MGLDCGSVTSSTFPPMHSLVSAASDPALRGTVLYKKNIGVYIGRDTSCTLDIFLYLEVNQI